MIKTKEQQNIPNGWKETKLSELLVEVNERNREQAELPVLSVTNSRGFVLQSEQFARNVHSKNTSNYKIVSKEQFAYNPARINVGSIALLRKWEKGLLSPMYVVFGTKDELLNDYLRYYIQSPRFSVQVSNNTAGSVRKSLNFNAFEHFDYVYPKSQEEQKKIVEVLVSVDENIKKTKEVIEATEKLKKGLMQQLFSGGELVRLEDIADVSSGKTPSRSNKKYYENGTVLWVKSTEVKFSEITQTSEKITEEAVDKENMRIVPKGAVLLAMYGQGVTRGKSAILGCDAATNQAVAAIVPDSKKVLNTYLYYWLVSKYEDLRNLGHGGNQKNLNSRIIKSLELPVVSIKDQERIISILIAVDEKTSVNQRLLAKQTKLKNGLMQDLLSGIKRVKV